jgi:hypothetical protein
VPFASEGANYSFLVGGREAGEKRRLLCRLGQFWIGHSLYIAAQEHGVGREAHVLAHLAANEVVVSGQDFHRYAVLVKGPIVRARSSASACFRPPEAVRRSRSNSSPSLPAASNTAGET